MVSARTDAGAFRVAGLEAEAGTKSVGTVTALELVDGSTVDYPVALIAGAKSGPSVYVGAAIHGDEVNGVEIAHEVIRQIDPAQLMGNVVCVPMQNPLALRMQHRLPLQLLIKSPMDQFPGDPWMCFPGNRDGNSSEAMAAVLFDMMRTADAVIDIHTPTTGGKYVPFIFLPHPRAGGVRDKAMDLAKAFSPDFILAAESGVYVMDGSLHVTVAEHGIPAFGVELGEGGRIEQACIDRGVSGVLNVLRHLGMLSSPIESSGPPRVIASMTAMRAKRGGMLHMHASLGAEVKEGELLASITDRFGDVVEEIKAVHSGPFMRTTTFATVSSGERVAQIGVEV